MLTTHRNHGFTIVELMIGLAIVAIVIFSAIPSYTDWIQNTKIRNAAESVMNGLQLARTEAIRQNTNVRFELSADSGWTVRIVDSAQVVQQRFGAQGSDGVTVAIEPGATTMITFNSLGRVAPNANGSVAISQITFDVPTNRLPAALSRDLRLTISPAGRVRMCDPNVSEPTDIRNCNV